ncbi:uncharacterized protein LOC18448868 [Amborella trichopoda]|uniref:Uncharacterized protein n=1 Tax=Amborella trichopoda TaxID=13333 RepID=U5DG53_AMBTC|nr:uncharacterized protein LOC18448868 [Amborella trichopoda]XP_020532098.1 uncharacterized protein LOC18448868 [Amborella trichopoda]XP_020532099.1 uncharacterized protein LOC18448868 [Amborella trichopoda]ERN20452.1 hypothetical protein AMTR_s00068p00126890 [Amborella trichopoda]|eukprot:XP_006858985.1 uncharacterized protein LOC18448868 [Amborella trichopoda]
MADMNGAEPLGQNLIKLISNVCFSLFVMSVLIFTVIAITYQPPDPWLESTKAITAAFSRYENATFHPDDSVLSTGEDLVAISPASSPTDRPLTFESLEREASDTIQLLNLTESCEDASLPINCSNPSVRVTIERFNLKVFSGINFFDYQTPVRGSKPDECDVAWRFRSKKEKSWRKYRDFRRFRLRVQENCRFEVVNAGKWHSGVKAKPPSRINKPSSKSPSVFVVDEEKFNDSITNQAALSIRKGKYLYYSRGGDYCKGMNHFLWSFLCALGEAQYLNRTFVMDLSMCLAANYNPSNKDEEGKDFRFYFDFDHMNDSVSIVEEGQFLREWKQWDRKHKKDKIPVRTVTTYKVSPMQLRKDKSTIIWRQFDTPEPENYWYRVCEGQAAKYIKRPWHALWKSKRLMNIVSEISGRMDWDFDAVHVVRGEKAMNKELWPNLDSDTSPGAILEKVMQMIKPRRKLYIATNEPFYNYFDKLRSKYEVHLLDDYKDLWGNKSEWYNETKILTGGQPVEFDGYMRVEVDTEVLVRAKKRVETFNDLTKDCKDGINTC